MSAPAALVIERGKRLLSNSSWNRVNLAMERGVFQWRALLHGCLELVAHAATVESREVLWAMPGGGVLSTNELIDSGAKFEITARPRLTRNGSFDE